MNAFSLLAATIVCGGMAFLVYSVPVVSQVAVIGMLGFVWFFYARKLLMALAGKSS
jgi:hypothetical protein